MKKFIIISLFSFTFFGYAQINELGISLAGSNYIGDVGNRNYINPNALAVGLVYKWNVTPRMAYRLDATYIKLASNDANSYNDVRLARGYSFKNSVKELAIGIEFNYYDYSMIKREWRSTPYLIVQIAGFNYNRAVRETTPDNFETESKTGFTIPFGIGYKTTLGRNIGLGFETKFRYSFTDELDYNNPDIPKLSFGNPDSNDWYVTTGITIVFGFGRRGCYSGAF